MWRGPRPFSRLVLFPACLAVAFCFWGIAPARADLLTPNGNPTGASSAQSPTYFPGYNYTVSLDPGTATTVFSSGGGWMFWLKDALSAEGYNSANGWTITSTTTHGSYTLGTYAAWTETMPAITQGALSYPSESHSGAGGVAIGLNYDGNDGGHWIQVIRTNSPGPGAVTYTKSGDPGFYYYVDNINPTTQQPYDTPFYDAFAAADATDFVDTPYRPYSNSLIWQAEVFAASGDLGNKTIQIVTTGIQWGGFAHF